MNAGEAVLAETVTACKKAFGPRLLAAYALGSLAHGGFSPLVSDVDLGVVLADPLRESDEEMIQAVADAVRGGGSVLHERLSLFWGTPATLQGDVPGGRFPPLDRLDLLESGRLLAGHDARQGLAPPGHDELLIAGAQFALEYLGGEQRSLGSDAAGLGSMSRADQTVLEEFRTPALLVSRGPRRLTKIVLFPVRFLFTAATGQVGTNARAVDHYLADPRAPAAELVVAALDWRHAPPQDDDQAAALLGRELVPLYLQFIGDYSARLLVLGRSDLAEYFQEWRARLLA